MDTQTLNNALTVTFPEGFHVLSEEEKKKFKNQKVQYYVYSYYRTELEAESRPVIDEIFGSFRWLAQ